MKANHILFSALAVTLFAAYNMTPSDLLKQKDSFASRIPASAEEVKPEEIKKEEKKPADNVQCKNELKGEKLEKEVKTQTHDIEAILKEIDSLKNENKELKEKFSAKKPLKESVEESVQSDSSLALMLHLTTMFTSQMQSQMDMQMQMMSMMAQFQFNSAPQHTWDLSQQKYSPYGIHENFGMGIGIPASGGMWGYQNPYSQLPQMSRQPAQQQADFGFSFGQIPQANNMRGFDFNLGPSEPLLPQMERQPLPQGAQEAQPLARTQILSA